VIQIWKLQIWKRNPNLEITDLENFNKDMEIDKWAIEIIDFKIKAKICVINKEWNPNMEITGLKN
jgi:hypothetical protein